MRQLILFFFILLFCFESSLAQRSGKRGLAFGGNSKNDLKVLAPGTSWWYNWSIWPESNVETIYQDLPVDYVPMSWNGQLDTAKLVSYLKSHPQIRYLLGFNEPNFLDQARMTPSEAAAKWPILENIADRFDLKLVSPAVNYCGNCVSEDGVVYTDPVKYLDDFFAKCQGCRVDYVAVHWYGCGGLDWYLDLFRKYEKPIWVTEIACWDNENISLTQQKQYLTDVVWLMENDADVYRYAWFTGRSSGPNIDILDTDGRLSELGALYLSMPAMDTSHVFSIPAKIEAEQFQDYLGCLPKETSDEEGVVHMAGISAGDYLTYKLSIPDSRIFHFDLRYYASSVAAAELFLDDQLLMEIELAASAGWQTFRDSVMLPAGKHQLKVVGKQGSWSANWFAFLEHSSLILGSGSIDSQISVYPNPVQDWLFLEIEFGMVPEQILLFDLAGKQLRQWNFSEKKYPSELYLGDLLAGIYLLRIQSNAMNKTFRIIKE